MDRFLVSPIELLSKNKRLLKKNLRFTPPAEIAFINYGLPGKSRIDVVLFDFALFQLSQCPAGEVVFSNLRSFCEGKRDSDAVFSLMVKIPPFSVTRSVVPSNRK